jgi:hypothetical protein
MQVLSAAADTGTVPDEDSNETSLTTATWNIGRGTIADARRVLSEAAVVALQEAGDRATLLRRLQQAGYRVVKGTGRPGQSATPVVFDPSILRLVRPVAVLMAPRQRVGPGTGPDTMKGKWLIGGQFVLRGTGIRLFVGSTHLVAAQYRARRAHVADRHIRNLVRYVRSISGIRFVLGDFNNRATSSVLAPLRTAGWTSDQIVARQLGTHGNWAPDQVWWKSMRAVRLEEHHTIRNHSDHDALVATVQLSAR